MRVDDLLDALLRKHFGKDANKSESEKSYNLFRKKCKEKGMDPDEYLKYFKIREIKKPSFTPERPFTLENEPKRERNTQGSANKSWGGNTQSSFWEDTFGEDWKGFGKGFGQWSYEDFNPGRKRKNGESHPDNTIRNVRFSVRQSKYSWATVIQCEEWSTKYKYWVPVKLVVFSDDFEFPRGYKEMEFIYETNGRTYFGDTINVTRLYMYKNGVKTKIFDTETEREERNSKGKPYKMDVTGKTIENGDMFMNFTLEFSTANIRDSKVPGNFEEMFNYVMEEVIENIMNSEFDWVTRDKIDILKVSSSTEGRSTGYVFKVRVRVKSVTRGR